MKGISAVQACADRPSFLPPKNPNFFSLKDSKFLPPNSFLLLLLSLSFLVGLLSLPFPPQKTKAAQILCVSILLVCGRIPTKILHGSIRLVCGWIPGKSYVAQSYWFAPEFRDNPMWLNPIGLWPNLGKSYVAQSYWFPVPTWMPAGERFVASICFRRRPAVDSPRHLSMNALSVRPFRNQLTPPLLHHCIDSHPDISCADAPRSFNQNPVLCRWKTRVWCGSLHVVAFLWVEMCYFPNRKLVEWHNMAMCCYPSCLGNKLLSLNRGC